VINMVKSVFLPKNGLLTDGRRRRRFSWQEYVS
jgi:hypothetical protein